MTLYDDLTQAYRHSSNAVMFIDDDGRRWTLADIEALCRTISRQLRAHRLQPGDRVLVQVQKSVQAVGLYLACLRSGVVMVPLNTAYTREERDYFIADAQPALAVLSSEAAPGIPDVLPVLTLDMRGQGTLLSGGPPEENVTGTPPSGAVTTDHEPEGHRASASEDDDSRAAVIIYTSGTTGRSKGAVLTTANLRANAAALASVWAFERSDVLLHTLPVFHVHGLFVALNTALIRGAVIRFCARFEVDQVCRELPDASVFMGVPTYYTRLLDHAPFDASVCASVRLFISGSAPLLPDTFARFEQRTGQRIVERYGMSETNILTSNPIDGERLAGSVGFALPDTDLRVVDDQDVELGPGEVGHVQVRGSGVFGGYWRRDDLRDTEFTSDGFFRTGDLGALDKERRLWLQGREKDLIISGGLNVYPADIERVLDSAPGVLESAVVGVPDEDFGERVVACVVAQGQGDAQVAELRAWCAERLANFKRPKAYHLLENLPRNTMGKVQKKRLREWLLGAADA